MNPTVPKTFQQYFDKSRKSLAYWEERAILDFTEGALERMENKGVSKNALAGLLKVSLPYVMKLIGGSNNFTMRTMVKVAHALGARLHFEFKDDVAEIWQQYQAVAPTPTPVSAPVTAHTPAFVAGNAMMQCESTRQIQKPAKNEYLALAA